MRRLVPVSVGWGSCICELLGGFGYRGNQRKVWTCQGSFTPALTAQIREPRIEMECFWLHTFNIVVESQNIKNSSREYVFPIHTK